MANKWMPRDKWDALIRGDDCTLCRVVLMTEQIDEFGHTVTDLGISRLRLCSNQYIAGYCSLICHKHVCEPHQLSHEESKQFFEDMTRAGQAIEQVYGSDKINFLILGNSVPHLHCHLIPRYYGDPAPGTPLLPDAEVVKLTPEQYQKQINQIRRALGI